MRRMQHYQQVYHYYVRSRYDFIVSSAGFDLTADSCNTEIIRFDDEHFGLVPRDPVSHGSNYTTHTGATHFLYGSEYDSEYVGDDLVRDGIPAEHWTGPPMKYKYI